nr:MAG TPA: hypothetical protein [Caudoviricetes sp.]
MVKILTLPFVVKQWFLPLLFLFMQNKQFEARW